MAGGDAGASSNRAICKQLVQAAWPQKPDVGRRTVDVSVGRLRRTLTSAAQRDLILTVWSIGYALTARSAAHPWRGGRRWPKGPGRSDRFRRDFARPGSSPLRHRLPPLLPLP